MYEGYFGVCGVVVSGVKFARYCGIERKNLRYCGVEFSQRGLRYCTNINIQTSCNAIFLTRNKLLRDEFVEERKIKESESLIIIPLCY